MTLTSDDSEKRSGLLSQKFILMMDELSRQAEIPSHSPAFAKIKTEIMTLTWAQNTAKALWITFIDRNGRKGRIGAPDAVLWGNWGIEAAGLYGKHL